MRSYGTYSSRSLIGIDCPMSFIRDFRESCIPLGEFGFTDFVNHRRQLMGHLLTSASPAQARAFIENKRSAESAETEICMLSRSPSGRGLGTLFHD